jgi:hypothetical protein
MESLAYERANKKGRGPVTGVIQGLNKQTGKSSQNPNAFSEINWGDQSRKYHAVINDTLRPTSFPKIVDLVREHMVPTRRGASKSTMTTTGLIDDALDASDQRMQVIDISDCSSFCLPDALLLTVLQDGPRVFDYHQLFPSCPQSLLYPLLCRLCPSCPLLTMTVVLGVPWPPNIIS